MNKLNSTLCLQALESREVPAAIGLVKGGPQPEPPTDAAILIGMLKPTPAQTAVKSVLVSAGSKTKYEPTPPVVELVSKTKVELTPPVKAGFKLSTINEWAPAPPFANVASIYVG